MQNPYITFGVPTYNRPNRLLTLLTSIYSQLEVNTTDFEIVVSDNSTNTDTEKMLFENFGHKPNLIYHKNTENIGSERNIRQVFDLGKGHYTWLMPDDDYLSTPQSLKTVIDTLKKYDSEELTFAITNLKGKHLDEDITYFEKLNPINKDVYFEDGKDILNMLSDTDLLGAQRLLVKKGTLPHPFEKKHTQTGFVGCMSIALVAASKGATLYISNPVVTFCLGDESSWRSKVPKIYYFDMPYLLLEAVVELGYNSERVKLLIQNKKKELKSVFNPYFFLFQLNDFKWKHFIKLYGFQFFCWNLFTSPFNILFNTKIVKKILKQKVVW